MTIDASTIIAAEKFSQAAVKLPRSFAFQNKDHLFFLFNGLCSAVAMGNEKLDYAVELEAIAAKPRTYTKVYLFNYFYTFLGGNLVARKTTRFNTRRNHIVSIGSQVCKIIIM